MVTCLEPLDHEDNEDLRGLEWAYWVKEISFTEMHTDHRMGISSKTYVVKCSGSASDHCEKGVVTPTGCTLQILLHKDTAKQVVKLVNDSSNPMKVIVKDSNNIEWLMGCNPARTVGLGVKFVSSIPYGKDKQLLTFVSLERSGFSLVVPTQHIYLSSTTIPI